MELHKRVLTVLFLSMILAGCSNTIDENQWSLTQDDISIEEVEKSLGNPTKTITDKQEMLDEVNSQVNSAKNIINGPVPHSDEVLEPIIQTVEDLDSIHQAIENDDDIKILQYEIKDQYEDGEKYSVIRNIYLHRDRVIYYDGANF